MVHNGGPTSITYRQIADLASTDPALRFYIHVTRIELQNYHEEGIQLTTNPFRVLTDSLHSERFGLSIFDQILNSAETMD